MRRPYKSTWPTTDREQPLSPLADSMLVIGLTCFMGVVVWGIWKLFAG